MQVDIDVYLKLAEKAGAVAMLDIEATGLRADYNSVLVVSFKPHGKKPISSIAARPGDDRDLMIWVREQVAKYPLLVTYYGKGFDAPMLNSRLLFWNLPELPKHHHLDLYWLVKGRLKTARKSQAHLLEWLNLPEEKMTLSADVWNRVLSHYDETIGTLVKRCESDVRGLEVLYDRVKHLQRNVAVY